MNLSQKNIIITGGSDGLGFSLARLLVEKGANVAIISRTQSKVDGAVSKLTEISNGTCKVLGYAADVSSFQQLSVAAEQIKQEFSQIHGLVNNAGIWLEGNLQDQTEQEISAVIDVNVKGVLFATNLFLPTMLQTDQGHIINVASTSGLRGREKQAVYAASKFAVQGFSESLKIDLADTSVKVSGFYPGGMKTGLFEKAGYAKDNNDWMDPAEVALILVQMLEQDSHMVMDHVVVNKRRTRTSN
jgi:3-oxoacyl-[acyl-carrier protein] reductase